MYFLNIWARTALTAHHVYLCVYIKKVHGELVILDKIFFPFWRLADDTLIIMDGLQTIRTVASHSLIRQCTKLLHAGKLYSSDGLMVQPKNVLYAGTLLSLWQPYSTIYEVIHTGIFYAYLQSTLSIMLQHYGSDGLMVQCTRSLTLVRFYTCKSYIHHWLCWDTLHLWWPYSTMYTRSFMLGHSSPLTALFCNVQGQAHWDILRL